MKIHWLLAVFLIWVIFSCSFYIWLKTDTRPLVYDQACLFKKSLLIHNSMKNSSFDFMQSILSIGRYSDSYKPTRILLPITSALLFFVFGVSEDSALFANILYISCIIFFTYFMCARYLNKKIGLLAVIILCYSPLLFTLSLQLRNEIPAAAMVTICMYLLLRADYFKNRLFSLLFGIAMGLGFLSKEFFIVYMFGPLCYVTFRTLKRNRRLDEYQKDGIANDIFINWLIAMMLGLVIALIWYIPHFNYVKFRIMNCFREEIRAAYGSPALWSFDFFVFYVRYMINFNKPWFYFVMLCTSIVIFYRNAVMVGKDYKHIFLMWFFIPTFVLTFVPNKCINYHLPSYPAVAIIISAAIINLRKVLLRRILITVFIIVVILQFFFYRFSPDNLPQKGDWRIKDILSYLYEDHRKQNIFRAAEGYEVLLLFNADYVSVDVLQAHQLLLYGIDSGGNIGWVHTIPIIPLDHNQKDANANLVTDLGQVDADYILAKTGDQGNVNGTPLDEEKNRALAEQLVEAHLYEKLPKQFILPDNSQVSILRKKFH